MKSISPSSLAIALIWVFVLASAVLGTDELPPVPANFSPPMTVAILVMPILFFGVMPFWARHSPFYHPTLARYLDGRFGAGALASFLVRLRPLLLFAAAAVAQGILLLLLAFRSDSPSGAYVIAGFFLSGGIGFAAAHCLLYLRKAVGVYPSEKLSTEDGAAIPTPERKPLREALRIYWKALIGIALFPAVAFVGGDFLHIPFDYVILPFFTVCFLAAWPYLSGRAPYTFWLVAMLVFLAGGFFAALLSYAVRLTLA